MSFIVVSVAWLAVSVFMNQRSKSKHNLTVEGIGTDSSGALVAEKVRYTGTRDDRVEWELEARTAKYLKDTETALLEGVNLVFYASSGSKYTLVSREGSYSQKTGDIGTSGDVVVVSEDGYRLKTESLNYSAGQGRVATQDPVSLESKWINLTGVGLTVEVGSGRIKVHNKVRTVIRDGIS